MSIDISKHFDIITDYEDLEFLPEYSIILCEIEEYHGTYQLIKSSGCCSGWHDFNIWDDAEIEIVDDYTPTLPALVIVRASSVEDDAELFALANATTDA